MKKYVKPNVTLLLVACEDVCTVSVVDGKFDGYDFNGKWL